MSQEIIEKTINVENILVNYKSAGTGQPILILHGWGSSSDSWIKVQQLLVEKGHQVIVPDLPGFGKTDAPNTVWGVQEYEEFVSQFTREIELQTFILAGHSFGGQIAVQFAVKHAEKVEKLIPIAAAAIRHEPSTKAKILAAIASITPKSVKKMLSIVTKTSDYGRSQGIMKDIMKKVIEQDFTSQFDKIAAPTLIIWGDKDDVTPTKDAYVMHELIPNSKLEIIPDGKHALNFQLPNELVINIVAFLKH